LILSVRTKLGVNTDTLVEMAGANHSLVQWSSLKIWVKVEI
jgi:hypothetical protein